MEVFLFSWAIHHQQWRPSSCFAENLGIPVLGWSWDSNVRNSNLARYHPQSVGFDSSISYRLQDVDLSSALSNQLFSHLGDLHLLWFYTNSSEMYAKHITEHHFCYYCLWWFLLKFCLVRIHNCPSHFFSLISCVDGTSFISQLIPDFNLIMELSFDAIGWKLIQMSFLHFSCDQVVCSLINLSS